MCETLLSILTKPLFAAMALLGALLLQTAGADENAGNALIRLQSRIFEMRIEPAKVRRYGHFIPINRVKWIQEVMNADPYLRVVVIHIQDRAPGRGTPIWAADLLATFDTKKKVPEKLQLEGYDAFWRHSSPTGDSGDLIYFPREDHYFFSVGCPYLRHEGWPGYCGMVVSYPPDPLLRIKVRVYNVTRPFNDFREIAYRTRALVYCLDVTEAVEAGTWEQSGPVDPKDLPFETESCLEYSS